MFRITKTRQVQLLHVLSRSSGKERTSEHVESSWMAPVTITRLADRDTVIRLVCTEPSCKHQAQDVRVKSIMHVTAIRFRWAVWAIILFAITGALGVGIPSFFTIVADLTRTYPVLGLLGFCIPLGFLSFFAAVGCTIGVFNYQGIDLITPREGLGHDIKVSKTLVV